MECITQNIHMDVLRCKIESQFTLEQDCNVADSKPDIAHILLSDGFIKPEEIRPSNGEVTVRGKLCYHILYSSEDCFGQLFSLQGKIPFEECLQVPDLTIADSPQITIELEHLQIHSINSRKINVRALLLVNGLVEDISDTPLCHDLTDAREEMQLHHTGHNVLNLCVMKKDICRIREEARLHSSLPDMAEILWEQTQLCNIVFHPCSEKLLIKGELSLLLLYRARNERETIEYYETTIPFQSALDCTGCKDGLIPHITYSVSQKSFEILPDADGLERIVSIDLVLDLCVKLYEDVTISPIDDLYGIHTELIPAYRPYPVKKLVANTLAKMRFEQEFSINEPDTILQILCTKAQLCPQYCTPGPEGIEIDGFLSLQILTITEDDRLPYRMQKAEIPFRYCASLPSSPDKMIFELSANLETCQVTPASGDTFTVKCQASFDIFSYWTEEIASLTEVSCMPYSREKLDSLPGITLYYVHENTTLWEIAKDCLTPLQSIRETNALASDTLIPGQKLFVMR